ncbi:NAD-dependent succinate-semialdehyde dehydrogenase [Afipia sp. Root123D2]|uniref:NAD-dependent succinate-semialdehyde dehydrogenase n=1 Tax=Afipia sp. Root123D2 TaxID=1736436 RepID=UPI0006FE6671|nr:NAD-dependent succinate-semialdehyde dehydrogenase [Afipia sp. Root123D2]KQW20657.1 NAD-dependent succinate-semialdehyde dehydrogenase [Afipia sp. Root123D2]
MYPQLGLYIDGKWLRAEGRASEPVINPATEQPIADLWHATDEDLGAALEAAKRAFPLWRKVSPYERAKLLRKAADLLRERRDDIALTLTLEQGKILAESRGEVDAAADIIEWAADEGRRTYGRLIAGRTSDIRQMVIPEPVGPAAAFTPWNFPATTPARKIATALAAGCPIIIKAAEETPGTCIEIVKAFDEAGVPPGVLSLVFGKPAHVSETLIANPIIRKISFTGSVPVGKHLTRLAADGMKRVTMELGGHSPAIVFPDVDPAQAAKTLVGGKYRNAGQVCIAPSRFYVHSKIEDAFVSAFVSEARKLKLGDGVESSSTMGPMANPRRLEAMDGFMADSALGGETLLGGARTGNRGYFFEPTVIRNASESARLMREEPFGPIAPIAAFDDFDEVIAKANALPYGLAAYVFTSSTKTALAVSDEIESGMVAVNSLSMTLTETPMGGVKDSGQGYEGGVEGVEGYLNRKFVSLM